MKVNPTVVSVIVTHTDHYFTYRGIRARLCLPQEYFKAAYYVLIPLRQLKDKDLAERLWLEPKDNGWYDYFIDPLIDIWMHHGITSYHKKLSRNDSKVIEIGCDYGHLWDEGYPQPDLFSLQSDAMRTIDSVLKNIPMFQWCQNCGELSEANEGSFFSGSFQCSKCIEKREANQ